MLVVLEGADGAGTSTLQQKLLQELTRRGCLVRTSVQPNNYTSVGGLIRKILVNREIARTPEMLALLFAADRVELRESLEGEGLVICDRHVWSSLAYQGSSVSEAWIEEINRFATVPDLVLYVRTPFEVASNRMAGRALDSIEQNIALQQSLLERFDRIYAESSWPKAQIDGTQSAEEVAQEALRILAERGLI